MLTSASMYLAHLYNQNYGLSCKFFLNELSVMIQKKSCSCNFDMSQLYRNKSTCFNGEQCRNHSAAVYINDIVKNW